VVGDDIAADAGYTAAALAAAAARERSEARALFAVILDALARHGEQLRRSRDLDERATALADVERRAGRAVIER